MKFLIVIFLFCVRLHAETVSYAAGQVGNYVVTSREVLISNIIDQFLLMGPQKKTKDHSHWILKLGTDEFENKLAQTMLEILVKLEAESFSVGQVVIAEQKAEVQNLKDGLKDWKEWQLLEVSDSEVEQMVLRKKTVKNFLNFKTESSGVVVSEEDIKNYYDKNRVKFGNAPLAQFKDNIKELLSRQQLEEKLKDWFELLKRKHRVKFLKRVEG